MSVIAIGGDREHRDPPVEHVVLVDGRGRPIGTSPKRTVHHAETPLHLAFSCHVVRADGAVLLTRRALTKPTWPGAWTNACCGHPQLGESLRDATVRRLQQELGVAPVRLALAIPDFVYRAEMSDGVVEHELCPVLVGRIDGDPQPNDAEVADFRWVPWPELIRQVTEHPTSLSPWSVEQFTELIDRGWAPDPWLAAGDDDPLRDTLIRPNTVPTSRRPPPLSTSALDVVDRQVVPRLDRILADKSDAVRRIDPHLGDLVGEIITLVQAGGKRLRPAFVYWGHRATGAAHDDRVIDLAVAMELLHTFALLHDDVMDRSEHRRGSATAHRSFASGHRAADRLGDSEWFGTSAAVLAGDLTFVLADEVLERPPSTQPPTPAVGPSSTSCEPR